MVHTENTGGLKEFHYSKEDMERIESTDTRSTREFKQAYKEWLVNKPAVKKKNQTSKKSIHEGSIHDILFAKRSRFSRLRSFLLRNSFTIIAFALLIALGYYLLNI